MAAHPLADARKTLLCALVTFATSGGADIEEEVAAFADAVDEGGDELSGGAPALLYCQSKVLKTPVRKFPSCLKEGVRSGKGYCSANRVLIAAQKRPPDILLQWIHCGTSSVTLVAPSCVGGQTPSS